MMRKFFLPFAMLFAMGLALVPANKASADDFIDLNLAGVAPALRGTFRDAERFWESRINGYSNTLPIEVRNQLTGRVTIDATIGFIDGPGNILGQAGPDTFAFFQESVGDPTAGLVKSYAIPTSGSMAFEAVDIGADFAAVVLHEMAHVLGVGSLWQFNGLISADGARTGLLQQKRTDQFQYVGKHGLAGFRRQSGHHRANYVPTEQDGGGGTALGHWEGDNWFFNPRNGSRTELMTGFATGRPTFVSEATWGSLADIGWSVDGFNAGNGAVIGLPSGPVFPKSGSRGFSLVAVPEPSSIAVIGLGLLGLITRRKRS